MNIEKIIVDGFKAFNRPYEFVLDKRLTVIFGANGTGKTSLCDAVEWGFLGKLPQYKSVEATLEDAVLNRNNPDREAKVTISLKDSEQKTVMERGAKSKKVWKPTQGAKLKVLEGQEVEIIPDTFLATVYLRQEALREFIEAKPEKRRPVLSSLLGLEYLLALEGGIDESVKLIGTEIQTLSDSIGDRKGEVTKYQDEIASLGSLRNSVKEKRKLSEEQLKDELKLSIMISKAKHLFERLKRLGDTLALAMPMEFKEDLPTVRTFSEKLLEIHRDWSLKTSQKLVEFEELKNTIKGLTKKIEECDEDSINQNIQLIEEKTKAKEKELGVKDSYSKVLVSGEEYFRLASPTECPLCENKIQSLSITLDHIGTKKRKLEEAKEIERLYQEVRELQHKRNEQKLKLDSLHSWKEEKEKLEKGFDPKVYEKTKQAEKDLEMLKEEALQIIDIHSIFKREQELAERFPLLPSEEDIRKDENKLDKLTHLHELVGILDEQLGSLSPIFVQKRIESLNPTIDEFAKILSPHPTFSRITIAYNDEGYWLKGLSEKNQTTYVQTLFSTGQLNEAAVLILLAMAKTAQHNLKFIILDDPSQSLDKDGKRRLAELLTKASMEKQIIVSTMDTEFAEFIKSSYPKATFFRFLGYEDEKGPVVGK
jgi:DNA repair exonuclease SbcCD ATPase subunit